MKINYTKFATVMIAALAVTLALVILIIIITMTSTLVRGNPANPESIIFPVKNPLIAPLSDTLFPPHNLFVDDVALVAHWDAPRGVLIDEDFAGSTFPPAGWQATSQGAGWASGSDGGSAGFQIPYHGTYAFVNDNVAGPSNNGCCDILTTPAVNLTSSPGYVLECESYFTGVGSQVASIEMSSDQGATWTTLATLLPAASWSHITIDLSAYSGPAGLSDARFAFHTADNYNQASGWAIDDVKINSPVQTVTGYQVFLDGSLLGNTDSTTYTFNPDSLYYGSGHLAGVKAVYATGISVMDTLRFFSHYLYPPRNLTAIPNDNAIFLSWDIPLGPDSTELTNLLGYYLYRGDDIPVCFIPDTTQTHFELNLAPGTYCFELSAIYDLTPYGFPGMTGESIKAGPACANISSCCMMPYTEDWATGSFSTNAWMPGQNWIIATQMGNPIPAAEFSSDPQQTDYALPLESYYMNSIPMGNSTSLYKIYFDFDIALDDNMATSNEKMSTEVWDGSSWVQVAEFLNNGDFAFTTKHIDISALAKNRVFKVRFLANGASSSDINYWLVDNIRVYYEFLPPLNLVSEKTVSPWFNVHLAWEVPGGSAVPNDWIHYDSGVNSDAIGTGAAADFNVAIRYIPSQLANYDGWVLKKMKFFPTEPACSYSLRVWTGANAANLVVDQPVAGPMIGDWNEVNITSMPTIDSSQELWIGYRCNATTGYPAGVDAGPCAAPGSSDLITLDGILWESISQVYGLDYNWNIQAFIEDAGDSPIIALQPLKKLLPVTSTIDKLSLDPKYKHNALNRPKPVKVNPEGDGSNRGLLGYKIYRKSDTTEFEIIGTTSDTQYDDLYLNCGCYHYYVTAVYDEGESPPSNIRQECLECNNIIEIIDKDINIFPNPSTSSLNIGCSEPIAHLSVFNILGSEISESQTSGSKIVQLNTSGYPPGTYILHITTAGGSAFHRRFVVAK